MARDLQYARVHALEDGQSCEEEQARDEAKIEHPVPVVIVFAAERLERAALTTDGDSRRRGWATKGWRRMECARGLRQRGQGMYLYGHGVEFDICKVLCIRTFLLQNSIPCHERGHGIDNTSRQAISSALSVLSVRC